LQKLGDEEVEMVSLTQSLLEKLQTLPTDKQQEILDFAEFLYQRFQQSKETQSSSKPDPIWDLGSEPIKFGINDAAENHDSYIYTSD
jgi:hypothetical protein